jgi:hypothetical protein
MSELEGMRRGSAVGSAPERRECEEEEVRIDRMEEAEAREITEEEEEVEERTGPPRWSDCSLRVWVLVGRGETRGGRGEEGPGDTASRLNIAGLEGSRGGVREAGVGRREEVEAESSSLVKVPCRTSGWARWGERGLAVEVGEAVRGEAVRDEPSEGRGEATRGLTARGPGTSLRALACRSCVARVPRGSLGEVWGEEVGRPRPARFGLGATGGGTVARFMGGE